MGLVTSQALDLFWAALIPLWVGLVGLGTLAEARPRSAQAGAVGADPGPAWLRPLALALALSVSLGRGYVCGPCGAQACLGPGPAHLTLLYLAWGVSLGAGLLGRASAPGRSLSPGPTFFIWAAALAVILAPLSGSTMALFFCLEVVGLCALAALATSAAPRPTGSSPLVLIYWVAAGSAVLVLWGLGLGLGLGASYSAQGSGLSSPSPTPYLLIAAGLLLKSAAAPFQWWVWPTYAGLAKAQLGFYLLFFAPATLALVLWLGLAWAPLASQLSGPASLVVSLALPSLWAWCRRTSSCSGLFSVSSALGAGLLLASLGA